MSERPESLNGTGAAASWTTRDTPHGLLDRAGEIFLGVRELGPIARDETIDRLCGADVELKKLVHLLMRGDRAPLPVESLAEDIRDVIDAGSMSSDVLAHAQASHGGDRIGRYRILERLGEGGFGVVYLAEQEQPVRRRVALKIIKLGMDTKQVVARFEAERQALALMDHPNIAKVFDAGATETGRPYFVMELVRGLPMTEYCDQYKLSIRQRLELIAEVCDALQHAHQKGVIHRDIKPSNVLVEGIEGSRDQGIEKGKRPLLHPGAAPRSPHPFRVKIIDFGVAKATGARLTEKTVFTEFRQMIGTPEYMSPEQASRTEQGSEDIDTRTDVYSVGVLLYELLTGVTPFDSKRLRSAAYGEMQRIIREEEPPKPSTKLTTCDDAIESVASRRAIHPDKLSGMVRGELDWIAMKAMEKDRSRRYASAGDMAADIRRYLSGHAVLAAPPSRVYKVRALVRRHRVLVSAGCVLWMALAAGLTGTTWGFMNARGERERTARKAEELKRVAMFQEDLLRQIDPARVGSLIASDLAAQYDAAVQKQGGLDAAQRAAQIERFRAMCLDVNTSNTARRVIDEMLLRPAIAAVDEGFAEQPLVDAQLRQSIAERYRLLGLFDEARRQQHRVCEIHREHLGAEHPDTIVAMANEARLLAEVGQLSEAETQAREAHAAASRALGADSAVAVVALRTLGEVLAISGEIVEAEACFRDHLALCWRVHGESHADTVGAMNRLGLLLYSNGKSREAEPLLRESLEAQRRTLGADHPDTLTSACNLALLLKNAGRYAEAEPLLRDTLERRRRVLGDEHPETITAMTNLGTLLLALERFDESEALLRRGYSMLQRSLGADHPQTLIGLNNLGAVIRAQGKLEEAEPLYRAAAEQQRRLMGGEHPSTMTSIHNLGSILGDLGRLGEAEESLREAREARRRVLGDEHPHTLSSGIALGGVLVRAKREGEAVELLSGLELEARRVFDGAGAYPLGVLLMNLGKARAAMAQSSEEFGVAETTLLEGYGVIVKLRGEGHKQCRQAADAMAAMYARWHSVEPSTRHEGQARTWKERGSGAGP